MRGRGTMDDRVSLDQIAGEGMRDLINCMCYICRVLGSRVEGWKKEKKEKGKGKG